MEDYPLLVKFFHLKLHVKDGQLLLDINTVVKHIIIITLEQHGSSKVQ